MAEVQSLTIDLENKGLMLARPGDVLPPGYLSSYMNMTANKMGFIESRRGSALVSSTNLGSAVSSQGRIIVNGTPYIYQGAGSSLYRAFSSIATGFSGNPLVMREAGPEQSILPQLIAFDSTIRMKDDGTTTTNFGIAGPMAAASAVAAAATTKTIDDFEYANNAAIQAAWITAAATVTTTTTNPYAGTYAGNLNVAASATGTMTRTVALNLAQFSVSGDSDDDDWIVIALRIDAPSRLIEVRFEFDVDPATNDFAHNYYWKAFTASQINATVQGSQSAQSAFTDVVTDLAQNRIAIIGEERDRTPQEVQPQELTSGLNQWTQFFVPKKDFTRVGSSTNNWANVAVVRISVQTNSVGAVNVGMDDAKLQGGTESRLDSDDYEWIYRYEDEVTQSLSPFSPPMSFTDPAIGVTVQKTKATVTVRNPRDTQASHIQLFRRGGDTSVFSFVLRQVVSSWTGTATITDGLPDSSLGDTTDETQIEMANLLQTPSAISTSVRKTTNNGGAYTDYTAAVGDDNLTTFADLSSLDTVGNGDWLVIGADQPFRKILIVMDNNSVNTNASVLTVQYWDGTAWRAVLTLIDGTKVSGKTLAQGGTISFVFPDDWERTTIDSVGATYVRLSVSAVLSGSVHVTEVRLSANAFDPTVCEVHGGRVWTDDALHKDRVWYSQRFSIEQFLEDNFIITTNSDPVVRPFSLDDQLFIFTSKTVERVVGSSADSFQPIATGSEQGLFSKWAICRGNGCIWYRGYDGIYKLPGSGFSTKTSLAIDPIFHGYASEDGTMQPVDNSMAATETMEFFDTQVMFGYTDTSGIRREIHLDIETDRWEPTDRPVTSYLRLDDVGKYYSGHSDGYVYEREVGNQDNGSDIAIRFNTGYIDFGQQSQGKQITEIIIDADLAGETVTFFAGFDNGTGAVAAQSVALSNSVRGPLQFPMADDTQARNVALGLDSNNGGSLIKFYKVTFFYIELPTLLTKLPTDWDDLGHVGDKRLRQLQIEIDTRGVNVSIAVQVDSQTTETLTVNTTSRQIVPFSLAADTIGKLTRLIFTGSGLGFRYYTHQFEFLKDPLQVTRYDTVELDLGYTRWKFLRRVWVSANTPATVTMQIYIDQTLRYTTTFTLISSSGWTKQQIKLPPCLKGMLCRFVFTSTSGYKVFLDQSDVEWRPLADQRGYQRAPMARST